MSVCLSVIVISREINGLQQVHLLYCLPAICISIFTIFIEMRFKNKTSLIAFTTKLIEDK